MGNSTSSVALPAPPSNPYPRHRRHPAPPPAPTPVNKVLPVPAIPDQRALLRSTQNGAILHQGGTISGRRYSIGAMHTSVGQLQAVQESSDTGSPQQHRRRHTMGSTSSKSVGGRNKDQKEYLHLSDGSPDSKNRHRKKQHFFGSEPDLRAPMPSHQPQSRPPRLRKKYRAPAPPPVMEVKGGSRDSPQRTRLFRTRAETQMSSSRVLQEVHTSSPTGVGRNWREAETGRHWREAETGIGKREGVVQSGKWLSSPEFQAELLRVTLDRGIRKAVRDPPASALRSREKAGSRESARPASITDKKVSDAKVPGNMEQSRKSKSQPKKPKDTQTTAPTPFYFGMEGEDIRTMIQNEEKDNVERFAAQVRQMHVDEGWTEEGEWRRRSDDEDAEESGIDLCLRPTLPKKQPQVPRFSPIAAWRLLGGSAAVNLTEHNILVAEGLLPEKVTTVNSSRVMELEPRGEKSADSGISGDASPGPGAPILRGAPSSPTVWTPQQDLAEDESSSEGSPINVPHPPHVLYLSLSLPRATDCTLWRTSVPKGRESSIDKLRRSVSGALFGRADEGHSVGERTLDDNWSLGRCGVRADGGQQIMGEGVETGCRGRVVYLPQGPLSPSQRCHSLDLLGGEILAGGTEVQTIQKEGWEEDAMRRVEEDFERGRAIDRARLRVQLRALNEAESGDRSVGYGPSSLPADVRYEPGGDATVASEQLNRRLQSDDHLSSSAPPSSSSSPLPSSSPSPSPARRRRGTPSSTAIPKLSRREWRKDVKRVPPPTRVLSEFRQQRREYREPPKGAPGVTAPVHQHIRHPSVVCDIPKSGDMKQDSCTNSTSSDSTPKTDCVQNAGALASSTPSLAKASNTKTPSGNYRRDFAHGSLPTPLQVLDVESESERKTCRNNPRSITPIGKHENTPIDIKVRSNASSVSSLCSVGAVKRGKCSSGANSLDVISRDAPSEPRINVEKGGNNMSELRSKGPLFTSLQPYTPGKGYRSISFNPGNQTQKLAQSVS